MIAPEELAATMAPLPVPADDVAGVYFDFGGVISVPATAEWNDTLYPYCESLGVSRAVMKHGFHAYRSLWDGGAITFADFYARTFADAGLPPPTVEQLETLWKYDAEGWVRRLRPDTLARMRTLKACGLRIGILSNMSEDFYERLFAPRCVAYRALADVEIISGIERMCKPERPIYDLAAERMGLPPERLLFYDDTPVNVEAARRYGWRAEVYPAVK